MWVACCSSIVHRPPRLPSLLPAEHLERRRKLTVPHAARRQLGQQRDDPHALEHHAAQAVVERRERQRLNERLKGRRKALGRKEDPENTHIGTITRFITPETPSMVRGREAASRPRPLNASAPSSATPRAAAPIPRIGTPSTNRANSRSAWLQNQEDQPRRELRAEQMAAPGRGGDQALEQVAVARDHQREGDAPCRCPSGSAEVPAPGSRHSGRRRRFADRAGVNASARPAARCSAASTAIRAVRLSGCVGS